MIVRKRKEGYSFANMIYVMRYNGSIWEYVGVNGLISDDAENAVLSLDSNGTPYVAYIDCSYSEHPDVPFVSLGYVSVQKYDGSSWEYVGRSCFAGGQPSKLDFVIDNSGIQYVVYEKDELNTNNRCVATNKYNGRDVSHYSNFGPKQLKCGYRKTFYSFCRWGHLELSVNVGIRDMSGNSLSKASSLSFMTHNTIVWKLCHCFLYRF